MWTTFIFRAIVSTTAFYGAICLALGWAAVRVPDRIFDVTNFSGKNYSHTQLVGAYLSQNTTPDSVVFLGSSFTFGYSWAARFAFPSVFARTTHVPSVNAAVVGASITGIEIFGLCELRRAGIRPRALVIEIPVVNELAYTVASPVNAAKQGVCASGVRWPLPAQIAAAPAFTRWRRHLGDIYHLYTYDYPDIQIIPVPDGYFATREAFEKVKEITDLRIRQVLAFAAEQADEVHAFVTPVFGEGVALARRDRANVEAQLAFAESVCKDVLGPRCFSTAPYVTRREMYANLTHFSIRGHEQFGKDMAAHFSGTGKIAQR